MIIIYVGKLTVNIIIYICQKYFYIYFINMYNIDNNNISHFKIKIIKKHLWQNTDKVITRLSLMIGKLTDTIMLNLTKLNVTVNLLLYTCGKIKIRTKNA